MKRISYTEANNGLGAILSNVCLNHEPVLIAKRGADNAVLISEEDWNSMQETLYLMSDKRFCEEIKDRMKTPISECVDDLDW